MCQDDGIGTLVFCIAKEHGPRRSRLDHTLVTFRRVD